MNRGWGLLVLLVAACGSGPAPHVGAEVGAAEAAVVLHPEVAAPMLALVNAARATAGCGALTLDPRLTRAAQGHAVAMAAQDFFSHSGANGSRVSQRVSAAGYRWQLVGENIAAGYDTADKAFATWAASPGHRANMLNCTFRQAGVALAHQADDQPLPGQSFSMRDYWVMDFGA